MALRRHRRQELKRMTEAQLEGEWRRMYPGKRSPKNKRKVREALMARIKPRLTPEEFIERERAEKTAKGPRCRHKQPLDIECEACRVEAEAVKNYMRLNKVDEQKARRDLCLPELPASPEPVASETKPLAPVTPDVPGQSPVAAAETPEDLVGFAKGVLGVEITPAQAAMAAEIEQHKARKRR